MYSDLYQMPTEGQWRGGELSGVLGCWETGVQGSESSLRSQNQHKVGCQLSTLYIPTQPGIRHTQH